MAHVSALLLSITPIWPQVQVIRYAPPACCSVQKTQPAPPRGPAGVLNHTQITHSRTVPPDVPACRDRRHIGGFTRGRAKPEVALRDGLPVIGIDSPRLLVLLLGYLMSQGVMSHEGMPRLIRLMLAGLRPGLPTDDDRYRWNSSGTGSA